MVGPVKTAVIGIGAITGTDQVYSTLTADDVTPAGATVAYQWMSASSVGGTYKTLQARRERHIR